MPCSSRIIILIPDCYSFCGRGGGGYRAKDLLPSQDLDRSLEPVLAAGISIQTVLKN